MRKTIINNGCEISKIEVIQNWVDVNKIQRVQRNNNTLFAKFGLNKDDFYVSYAGDIGLFQNWEVILDAAEDID